MGYGNDNHTTITGDDEKRHTKKVPPFRLMVIVTSCDTNVPTHGGRFWGQWGVLRWFLWNPISKADQQISLGTVITVHGE